MGTCAQRRTAAFLIPERTCSGLSLPCQGLPTVNGRNGVEPMRRGEAVMQLELRHVVISWVTRDELSSGRAGHFDACTTADTNRCQPVLNR